MTSSPSLESRDPPQHAQVTGIDHHALALNILRPRLSDRPFSRERTYARGLGGGRLRCDFILRHRHHQFFELQFHLVDQGRAPGSKAAQLALQLSIASSRLAIKASLSDSMACALAACATAMSRSATTVSRSATTTSRSAYNISRSEAPDRRSQGPQEDPQASKS